MVLGGGYFIYAEWRSGSQVMVVSVIDTRSGRVEKYRAYQKNIADRALMTVDGRRISLAETERMETEKELEINKP